MVLRIDYSNTSIEQRKRNELRIDIGESLEPARDWCCIYRVPRDLRQINEKAYTPRFISIGPFHYRNKELIDMEKQKVRYKGDFGARIATEKWEDFIAFIKNREQDIRNCYAETSKLQSLEFVTMVLYDAIFIIEFLLKNYEERAYDLLMFNPRFKYGIWLDLQLLENQLPYFVLEEIYRLAELQYEEKYPDLFYLSCLLFCDSMFHGAPEQGNVKHFLDLRRCALVKTFPRARSNGVIKDLPSAVKLHEAGVKFKQRTDGKCSLDVKFEPTKRMISLLNVNELQIPSIEIYDETESLFRNLMALEQCHYAYETHVCNYIDFMDFLINTEQDVELLVQEGIISNCVGDNTTVAMMFNQLCHQIDVSSSDYLEIAKDLKAHYDNPWNHAKSTLKSVYFSNPWRGTATIAAVILLVVTFIQTICSILQIV